MIKLVFLFSFLGISLVCGGFYTGFIVASHSEGDFPLGLFSVSIALVLLGLFSLIYAKKYYEKFLTKAPTVNAQAEAASKERLESTLQRNNELTSEWKKLDNTTDKLKFFKIAGDENV